MMIFANDCPKSWKIGEAERRFIFHSHKTGFIRNHSILWDTRSNPVWGQIVSLLHESESVVTLSCYRLPKVD